jgi:hypothetical protein
MERYAPSMSGKSYAYTQLGLSFLQDRCCKYSSKVVEMVMTQLSLKAALKQWGKDAKVAVEAEAKQLHWRNSFKSVHWKDVDKEKRKLIDDLMIRYRRFFFVIGNLQPSSQVFEKFQNVRLI